MRVVILLLVALMVSCDSREETAQGELSSQFSICNSLMSACNVGSGSYCLFGYKWGEPNQFAPAGFNVLGPKITAGTVTYSFQNRSEELNTHRQVDVLVKPFDEVRPNCARNQIRRAMDAWAALGDLDFVEAPEDSDSDIRFFAADIMQSGIGYPNFGAGQCSSFSGNVILKPNSRFNSCELFYNFVLHEIGHALGLGHVTSENIMNPNELENGFGEGDENGLAALYGEAP